MLCNLLAAWKTTEPGPTMVNLPSTRTSTVPSFIMVVLLGIAYKLYGGLQWMQAVLYGVGAAVIGIIANCTVGRTLNTSGGVKIIAIYTLRAICSYT